MYALLTTKAFNPFGVRERGRAGYLRLQRDQLSGRQRHLEELEAQIG